MQACCGHFPVCSTFSKNYTISLLVSFVTHQGNFGVEAVTSHSCLCFAHASTDERPWQAELEAQRSIWSTRRRTVIAGMENYLDKSDDMKLEIEELELLMDPEDSDTQWQAETVGWSTKEMGSRSKRGRQAI